MAMVQVVSDVFTRGSYPTNLGGGDGWTTISGFSTCKVLSANICEGTSASGADNGDYWSGTITAPSGAWPNDQYTEITIKADANSNCTLVVLVRCNGGLTFTQFYFSGALGTAQTGVLVALVAGSAKFVKTVSFTPNVNDVIRVSVTGSIYTVSQNGTAILTYTDVGSFIASGSPGFYLVSDATLANAQISKFAAGANQAATPTFSPVAGSYGPTQVVTVTSTTTGCTIYYTTNGTTPNETSSSISNGGTVSISATSTLKAIASLTNFVDSTVGSASYTINGAVTTTTFSPVAGSYTSTQSVTLSNTDSALSGFAQYYTIDGSTPTTGSTLYTGAITVSTSQTIKVLAVATNYSNSSIASATYTITSGGTVWSPIDSRVNKPNSATFRTVNGAQIDDVQTSSNPAIPGVDSRKAGAPVASGTYPQNSRTSPPFNG